MAKYHFIGMCGKAMGTLALMLQSQGHTVTGSDDGFYEPMLSYLTSHNITFYTGHKPENIPTDVDYIVIGKHAKLVPETNMEVKQAFDKYKEKIKSLPEILNTLTKNKDTIICAGSFGKSSITTLTSFILENTGVNPSYFIGAVPIDLIDSGKLTNSNLFVLEGDEYPSSNFDESPKFLHYNPQNVILTSCEHDHVNVYPTLESYLKPYQDLLKLIPSDGLLVYAKDGAHIEDILKNINFKKISYGLDSSSNYYPENIKFGDITYFDLMKDGEFIINIETILLGKHNILNIIGVCAMLLEKNLVSPLQLQNAIKIFHGVKGRLDKKTLPRDSLNEAEILNTTIPIIESYGSSLAKTRADIDAIKLHYKDKKIIDIFEPHTFGWRNRANLHWYDTAFNDVDIVYIFHPPSHGASADQLTVDKIVNRVNLSETSQLAQEPFLRKKAIAAANKEEVYELLKQDLTADSLILLTTSGSLDNLPEELPKEINSLIARA